MAAFTAEKWEVDLELSYRYNLMNDVLSSTLTLPRSHNRLAQEHPGCGVSGIMPFGYT